MKYISMVILASIFFTSPSVFAQGEEKDTIMQPAGYAIKDETVQEAKPAVLPDELVSKAGTSEQPDSFVQPDTGFVSKGTYKVGIGDVLDIGIIKPVPVNSRMTVASDGTITFPYIGTVQAKDRTLPEIQSDIENRLADDMNYPVVSVSLWEARSKNFTIYGQVIRPGTYLVGTGMSVLRAISVAGGLSVPDSIGVVRVLRPNKDGRGKSVIFESDITEVLSGKQDVVIQPGDTLIVAMDKFFVYGEVLHPGSYPVEENMSLPDAITIAGGFAFTSVGGYIESGPMGRVKLFRAKAGNDEVPVFESDINSIMGEGKQKVIVHAGDTIVVTLDKFFITGQVNRPGAYPVEEHMTLLNAISTAGGFTPDTSTGSIKLLRPKADGTEQQIDTDVTSVLNGTSPAFPIRPMDTIVVTANKFYVYGEVNKPGMYSLESRTNALTAISIAGGFSKFGSVSRVKVIRMDDKTGGYETIKVNITEAIAGNSQADVMLQANDVVVVSEGMF